MESVRMRAGTNIIIKKKQQNETIKLCKPSRRTSGSGGGEWIRNRIPRNHRHRIEGGNTCHICTTSSLHLWQQSAAGFHHLMPTVRDRVLLRAGAHRIFFLLPLHHHYLFTAATRLFIVASAVEYKWRMDRDFWHENLASFVFLLHAAFSRPA